MERVLEIFRETHIDLVRFRNIEGYLKERFKGD